MIATFFGVASTACSGCCSAALPRETRMARMVYRNHDICRVAMTEASSVNYEANYETEIVLRS
jgi:hypothetical protein